MRFLSGLLKTLAIILLVGATAVCTGVAVWANMIDAYITMGVIWVCAIFAALSFLGTGIALNQLYKLKERVSNLEQRPAAPVPAPAHTPAAADPAMDDIFGDEPFVIPPTPARPRKSYLAPKKKKNPLPVIIIICVVIAAAVGAIFLLGKDKPSGSLVAYPVATETPVAPVAPATEAQDAIPVSLGGSINHERFTMTFDSVEVLDDYSYKTSEYSSTSLFVEDGYKLLLVKGHFTNLSTETISDSSFVRTALVNGTYKADGFDVRINFLRNTSFEIDPYTDLDYVMYVNIPEKLANMYETVTFTIGFNNDMSYPVTVWNVDGTKTVETDHLYSFSSDGSAAPEAEAPAAEAPAAEAAPAATEAPMVPSANTISIGDTIYTDEYEFTLTNVELTYEVLPPNTSSVYTSYVAETGKVYAHVQASVKNTMTRDLRINELFTTSVLYDGKYPYTGFAVVNDGDNSFDWVGSYVAATPLETCIAHGLVECPAEVDTSGNSVVITMNIGGTEYQYTLR